ncbi:MAG TPA: Rap1a/Tai family immunity protein [Arsenicitalea sp.]|jgi:hypothetical protein|nr:Rap1a/Tai family immunity protein [Arsenicitalea sp.]
MNASTPVLALAVALLMVAPCAAHDMTGAELIAECSKPDASFCHGYVQARSEPIITRGTTVCIDEETTTREELTNAVAAWISRYKGDPRDMSVYAAFEELYPCD